MELPFSTIEKSEEEEGLDAAVLSRKAEEVLQAIKAARARSSTATPDEWQTRNIKNLFNDLEALFSSTPWPHPPSSTISFTKLCSKLKSVLEAFGKPANKWNRLANRIQAANNDFIQSIIEVRWETFCSWNDQSTRPKPANDWFSKLSHSIAGASLPFEVVERDRCCAEWRGSLQKSVCFTATPSIVSVAIFRGRGFAAHEFVVVKLSDSSWLRVDRAADPNSRLFRTNSSAAIFSGTDLEETVVVASHRDQLLPGVADELCRVDLGQENASLWLADLVKELIVISVCSPTYSLLSKNCRFMARRAVLDLLELSRRREEVQSKRRAAARTTFWRGAKIESTQLAAKLQRDPFGGRQQLQPRAAGKACLTQDVSANIPIDYKSHAAVRFCQPVLENCPTLPTNDEEFERRLDAGSPYHLLGLAAGFENLAYLHLEAGQVEEAIWMSRQGMQIFRKFALKLPDKTNPRWISLPDGLIDHARQLRDAGQFNEVQALLIESRDIARAQLAAQEAPTDPTSLLQLVRATYELSFTLWMQDKLDEALFAAEESYQTACLVWPLDRSDPLLLLGTCDQLSFLLAVWLGREAERFCTTVPPHALEGFHQAHVDLIKELHLVLEQPDPEALDTCIKIDANAELRHLEEVKDNQNAFWLALLQGTLLTARLLRQAEVHLCRASLSGLGIDSTYSKIKVTRSNLIKVQSCL